MGYTPFKMKYKNLEEVVEQLQSAVKAHGKQAKVVQSHIDEMKEKSPLEKTVSWKYGKGTYSGELIPSKETSTHRYARTHNGKIKSLPKK